MTNTLLKGKPKMSEVPQNKNYEAKEAYQDEEFAASYDTQRFSSFRGKMGDTLDKRTLKKSLAAISRAGKSSLRILDIPCGTGRISQYLLEQGESVTGADISNEMMQVAEQKVQSYDAFNGFYQMDASDLTFEDNSFDVIVAIRFMGHIPKDVRLKILKEFGRVSQYSIIEYNLKSKSVELRRSIDKALKSGNRLPNRWGWHIFEKEELYEEVKEAGLEVVKMWAKVPYLSGSYYVLLQRGVKD